MENYTGYNLDSQKIDETLMEEKNRGKYTEQDIQSASKEIKEFLNKLYHLKVIEKSEERPLNQLEQFLCIYEFVSNRVYEENESSHDITGVIKTNKAVCQGFSNLLLLLCNQVGISAIYKNCVIPEIGEDHGNIEICLADKKGNKHCLHCDPTIDSLMDENDVLKVNATLIADNDVNLFYHTQEYYDVGLYGDFLKDIKEKSYEISDTVKMFAELRGENVEELQRIEDEKSRKDLIKMADFFYLEESDYKLETHSEMEETYRKLYKQYQQACSPIENIEFLGALYNVQRAQLYYDGKLTSKQIEEKAFQIISSRIQASIKMQQTKWNNEHGTSFMFDIINGKFNYEQELKRIAYEGIILPNEIGKATLNVSTKNKDTVLNQINREQTDRNQEQVKE